MSAMFVSISNLSASILVIDLFLIIKVLIISSNYLAIVAMVYFCYLSFDRNLVFFVMKVLVVSFDALCCSGDHVHFSTNQFHFVLKFSKSVSFIFIILFDQVKDCVKAGK